MLIVVISKNDFSFQKKAFNDAKINEKIISKIAKEILIEENKGVFNSVKNHIVEKYKEILDLNIPKYFLFSRHGFYFGSKRELSEMKYEGKKD